MLVPLSWLRDYVAVDVRVEELAERLNISVAGVERIIRRGVADEDGNLGLYRVGRVLRPGSIRTQTGFSSAPSTWGRASRARSSAAPGTSARERPLPSRFRAPCFP